MKHKLTKPRLIIYNIPEEISVRNVTIVIKTHNPKITLNGKIITANFKYKTGNENYNILIKIGPKTRKKFLEAKLKMCGKYA